MAMKIIRKAQRKHLTMGKDPSGMAAAALYIASQMQSGGMITQHDLSCAANVTEVTIRNRKKELIEKLELKDPGNS
jgi:transcription initiation factor TFIIB